MKKNVSYMFNPFPAVAWLRNTGIFNWKNTLFNRGIFYCGMIFAEREREREREREHLASYARVVY
jgi:hypothetical protein